MYMLLLKHQQLVRNCVQRMRSDERGQSMVEYALLAFLVAIAAIVILSAIGWDLQETFDKVENSLGLGAEDATFATGDDDTAPALPSE